MLRRTIKDHLGQRDARLGSVAHIGVIIRQLLCLRRNRLGDLLAPVADIDAVKPRKGVKQTVTVAVFDMATLGSRDDPLRRHAPCKLGQMC